jgi:hypothetical protein
MNYLFLLFISNVGFYYCFIGNISKLRTIVSSTAILSTISNKINNEIINDNFILQLSHTHYHFESLYLCLILTYLWNYFNYYNNNTRLETFEMYSKTKKITNILFIVFMIIFNRDVENAI